MSSPTARTLLRLRNEGWKAQVVESFNSFTKQRRDLFNAIDIIAVRGNATLGVQCTTGANLQKRVTKIRLLLEREYKDDKGKKVDGSGLIEWMKGRDRLLQVWGWRKLKVKRGGKAVRWEATIVEV